MSSPAAALDRSHDRCHRLQYSYGCRSSSSSSSCRSNYCFNTLAFALKATRDFVSSWFGFEKQWQQWWQRPLPAVCGLPAVLLRKAAYQFTTCVAWSLDSTELDADVMLRVTIANPHTDTSTCKCLHHHKLHEPGMREPDIPLPRCGVA